MVADLLSTPTLPIHWQLMDLWTDLLGAKVTSIDADFYEVGGTAELGKQMAARVQRLTGVDLPAGTFTGGLTIRTLAERVIAATRRDGVFVTLQAGATSTPFYYFHGDILGGGIYARRLAELLVPEQPFVISAPLPLAGDELPPLEEIAARKRHALEATQPNGPYILGGFCVGAVVAFEMARQLELNGKEVLTVIMIEPDIGDPVSRSYLRLMDKLAARNLPPREKVEKFMRSRHKVDRLRQMMKSPLHETTEFVLRNGRKLFSSTKVNGEMTDGFAPVTTGVPPGEDRAWELDAYEWLLTAYVPHRYDGRVKVLVTDETAENAWHVTEQIQKAAPRAEVDRIPGTHLGCITTHLTAIAEKVQAELRTVQSVMATAMTFLTEHLWMFQV